jgi:hypothetical protein
MLEAVGHPHAVNPDKALRKVAAARGWPILAFSRPVELRRRHLATKPALAAVALGAGAAAAGAVVLASRRRGRSN